MVRFRHLEGISALALVAVAAAPALAQQALPEIEVGKAHPHPHPHRPPAPAAAQPAAPAPVAAAAPAPAPTPTPTPASFDSPSPNDPDAVTPPRPLESASSIYVSGAEVRSHSYTRPGESLEIVPGLLVTQHSGEGKANQYQLRGFQLDHGTDLAIDIDGVPLNMPTHGHGQGYADANFLIPELFSTILAHKGPYFANEGDFSVAGAIHINLIDELPNGLMSATAGSFDYGSLLAIESHKVEGGNLLSAAQLGIYNGPWTVPDEQHKFNGLLRWSQGDQANGFSITGMAYGTRFHASNQIPERAVTEGIISLWGNINPTDRGDTTRFSISTRWSETNADSHTRVEAFVMHNTLDLYNTFDYYLSQPALGDQFRQFDRRTVLGLKAEHGWKYNFAGFPIETRVGVQSRYDNIRVGLQDTYDKMAFQTLTNDAVDEGNVGVWTDTTVKWTPWLRTTAGIRGDYFAGSVNDIQSPASAVWLTSAGVPIGQPTFLNNANTVFPALIYTGPWNSGSKAAAMDSPKLAITLGPWEQTEFFINAGEGYHSTDLRGTVTQLSPVDGTLVPKVPLLVKARGVEVGARTKFIEGLDSTLTLWGLNYDSESQFDGDTGTTLFGRPSRRYGLEFNNHYSPYDWLHFDGDLSLSHARSRGFDTPQLATWINLVQPSTIGYYTFLGNAPGNYIPEGPPVVASIAVEVGKKTGWFGGLKFRFKGVYALTEDGYFKAPATGTVNARIGYKWENGLKLQIDGYNILNSRSDQISYAYGSLLPTDPLFAPCQITGAAPAAVCAIGQMDRHFKPIEPAAIRVTLSGPLSIHAFDPVLAPDSNAASPLKDLQAMAANVSNGTAFQSERDFLALASDLPNVKGAPRIGPPPVIWTGFYAGQSAGGAFGTSNLNVTAGPMGPGSDLGAANAVSGALTGGLGNWGDFIGGGQIGYNWRLGSDGVGSKRFVVGVEADLQALAGAGVTGALPNGSTSSLAPANTITGNVTPSASLSYLGTARARVGYLLKPALLAYATGGLAYGDARLSTQTSLLDVNGAGAAVGFAFGSTDYSKTLVGWTVGAGAEWMFHPNWSVKAEYLYYDLGAVSAAGQLPGMNPAGGASSAVTLATLVSSRFNGHVVRGGLDYHFDWGAPTPVVAKY